MVLDFEGHDFPKLKNSYEPKIKRKLYVLE